MHQSQTLHKAVRQCLTIRCQNFESPLQDLERDTYTREACGGQKQMILKDDTGKLTNIQAIRSRAGLKIWYDVVLGIHALLAIGVEA